MNEIHEWTIQSNRRKEDILSAASPAIIEMIEAKIPIWHKANLTVKEAAEYSGIGESSIREMIRENNSFSFRVGNKWLINRKLFDEYIMRICSGKEK